MLHILFSTVLAFYLGLSNPNMIISILMSYIFVVTTHFKNKRLDVSAMILSIIAITINRDFDSVFLMILGLSFNYPDAVFFIGMIFYMKPDLNRIIMILMFTIISYTFKKLEVQSDEILCLRTSEDRENLKQRLKRKKEADRKYFEEERIKYEERKNLLARFHHLIGHTITSSILELKAIEIKYGYSEVIGVRKNLEDGIKEIRKTLHTMRDEGIDFEKEAEKIKEEFQKNNISFKYDVSERSMDKNSKKELSDILKEGITNIIKHSDSSVVSFSLIEERGFFRFMLFNDDCKGENIKWGFGLESMKRFAEERNGYFGIDTENGFRIIITFPKGDQL